MILDLRDLEGAELTAELCVIGAGAAGIAIAREFAGASMDVLLLESGDIEFATETQDLCKGEIDGLPYEPLDQVRMRFFGGTTNHWSGQSTPLDPLDFEQRSWVPDSGWPISYGEFERYLPRAQKVCGLGAEGFGLAEWAGQTPNFPLDAEMFQPAVLRFPNPVPRFGALYRSDIESSPNVRCLLNANVLQLSAGKDGSVDHVEVASLSGPKTKVRARTFVLATGGIENSRLLLVSHHPSGMSLGNEHDMVGRHFMEHPNHDSGRVQFSSSLACLTRDFYEYEENYLTVPHADTTDGRKLRLDFRVTDPGQERLGILNHSAFLRKAQRPSSGAADVGRLMKLWGKVDGRWEECLGDDAGFEMRVRLEQAPNPASRIRLSEQKDAFGMPMARMSLQFGELEPRTIAAVHEEFARAIGAAELGRGKLTFDPKTDLLAGKVGWQNHHCGGTRMSANPRSGVVDANCRVHSLRNLYVAGSSVFPTGGHANPTLNLIALALRLSDHLKERVLA